LVLSFALMFARVAAFVALLPFLGGSQTPRMVKVGLAIALAVLGFGAEGTLPPREFLVHAAAAPWLSVGLALGREVLVGAVVGYVFSLFLMPARIAGEYIAEEMGLSIGGQLDPTANHSSSLISQALETLATLLFLGLDCHHLCIAALYGTFRRWPVGEMTLNLPLAEMIRATAAVEEWGLLVGAPVGVCLFLTSVVLALLSRLAPQLNIFNMGFALRVGVGLISLLVLLPGLASGLVSLFGHFAQLLQRLV
jgi:flagellar biosynthetic protein FliR